MIVYVHLAWAVVLSERSGNDRVACKTVQSGRLAPVKDCWSIAGPTTTIAEVVFHVEKLNTIERALDDIAHTLLSPVDAMFAGPDFYHNRARTWVLNCAKEAPMISTCSLGSRRHLTLDQSLSTQTRPNFGMNVRAFKTGDSAITVRESYNQHFVDLDTVRSVMSRLTAVLSLVCEQALEPGITVENVLRDSCRSD